MKFIICDSDSPLFTILTIWNLVGRKPLKDSKVCHCQHQRFEC